jgi:hypothetical protein
MKYRHKPTEVEAVQWTGLNLEEVQAFVTDDEGNSPDLAHDPSSHQLLLPTLHGAVVVAAGDWVLSQPDAGFWPCKPDIFEATYDEVPEADGTTAPDRMGDAATAGEPVADVAVSPAEDIPAPVTCPHAWAEGTETITCELEPGHEGAHVGPGGAAPPA